MRSAPGDINLTAFRLSTTSAPTETASAQQRKFIILMPPSSSAPPSSWIDWMWPVFWPVVTVVYLIDVNVFYMFYLINQAVRRIFT